MPSFDGENLIITLDTGTPNVDVEADLYSGWKEWQQLGGNIGFAPAFRVFGGDPLTPGVSAGAYFFLRNDLGWRIRPPEEDCTIYLTGNLVPEDSSLPILVPTLGDHRVLVNGLQPITQSVSGIEEEIFSHLIEAGITFEQVHRVMLAALAGLLSGMTEGTNPKILRFRDRANIRDRIVANVDGVGNRTQIVLDLD